MKTRAVIIALCTLLITVGCSKKESPANKNTPAASNTKQPAGGADITKTVDNATKKADATAKATVKAASKTTDAAQKSAIRAADTTKTVVKDAVKSVEAKTKELLAKINGPAPALKGIEWVKGGPVVLKPGKIYVVEFWATWCPPCRSSIPHLTEIQKKYKDKDVVVIGISNEKMDKVKPFVEKMGDKMEYNVAIDSNRESSKLYMQALSVRGIPHAFVINKKGVLVWHGHPMADMETVLDGVIAGDFDAVAYKKKQEEERAKQQKLIDKFNKYFAMVKDPATTEQAKTVGAELLKSDNKRMLVGLVWRIMNGVPEKYRDLDLASKAIKMANEALGGKDATILDIYAKVQFAIGKIKEAIELQTKAVDLSKDNQNIHDAFVKTLQKYKDALKNAAKGAIEGATKSKKDDVIKTLKSLKP